MPLDRPHIRLRLMLSKPFRLLSLLLIFVTLGWTRADAATASFHESFDSFDSNLWGVNYSTTPAAGANVFGIFDVEGTNYLKLRRTATGESPAGSANSFVFWKGNSEFAPSGKIDDFEMEIVIRIGTTGSGSSDNFGLAFRMSTTNYSSSAKEGYYVFIDLAGNLKLNKNPVNHTSLGTNLQTAKISAFSTDIDYTLKLNVEGSRIEANLYEPNGTEAVASLLITNAEYTEAGHFGIRTGFGNADGSVFYRDLTITAIPEPSQVALAGILIGGLLFWKARTVR